jgi:DNA-damage-inducible protein J
MKKPSNKARWTGIPLALHPRAVNAAGIVDVVAQKSYDMDKSLERRYAMAKSATIRARTDEDLKERVEGILHDLGMTTTEVVNLLFRQIDLTRGVPFAVRLPNAETRKTLEKSARGEDVKSFKNIDEMFKDLES